VIDLTEQQQVMFTDVDKERKGTCLRSNGIPSPRILACTYICKDSFSLADALNTCISVEVEASPNKHAPLDGLTVTRHRCLDGFFSFFPSSHA